MLIKDNIATMDQMNNTAGSYSLLGATVPRDATVAAKLRAAGVVLLGKSNMSQWANFRSSNSSNGWSAHGGQVTGHIIQIWIPVVAPLAVVLQAPLGWQSLHLELRRMEVLSRHQVSII